MSNDDEARTAMLHQQEMEGWFSHRKPRAMDRQLAYWSEWWGYDLRARLQNDDKRPRRKEQ